MPQQKISPARIYLLLVIVVSVGAVLGFLLAIGKIGKINLPITSSPAIDPRCGQKAKVSEVCSKVGYEFDSNKGKCIIVNGAGCIDNLPFGSPGECQKTCETNLAEGLPFETIGKRLWSEISERKNYIIKNNSEWKDLLSKFDYSLRIPLEIDFTKEMVIAVFQGEWSTGGYDIEITKIIETQSKLEVFVKEISPGPKCFVTGAFTRPYHIVKVQKSDKEVVFNMVREITDCK